MIRIINVLRANLVKKDVEETILRALNPPMHFHHDRAKLGEERKLHRINLMLRRLERVRRRTWAPWKDFR